MRHHLASLRTALLACALTLFIGGVQALEPASARAAGTPVDSDADADAAIREAEQAAEAAAAAADAAAPDACDSLGACMQRLRALAQERAVDDISGMRPVDTALAERLRGLPGVVEAMVPLLADRDPCVADLASYVLRDVPRIEARHLPQIEAGVVRGLGWLPPALARIEGEDAARAVVKHLLEQDTTGNQFGYALTLLGTRAVPHLVEAARCRGACDITQRYVLLREAFEGLSPDAASGTAAGLATLLAQTQYPADTQAPLYQLSMVGVVFAMRGLGKALAPHVEALEALRLRAPGLEDQIDDALIAAEVPAGGAILARRIAHQAYSEDVHSAARMGPAARAAVPALVALLTPVAPWRTRDSADAMEVFDESGDLPLLAAYALGAIGDPSAAPALIRATQDPADVRLNRIATLALVHLGRAEDAPLLRRLADTHWYPGVRAAARIPPADAAELFAEDGYRDWLWNASDSMSDEQPLACKQPDAMRAPVPRAQELSLPDDAEALEKLGYAATVRSWEGTPVTSGKAAPATDDAPAAAGDSETEDSDDSVSSGMVETTVFTTPSVALREDDGWLVGSDRGEWIGEVMWIADAGLRQRIVGVNVQGLHRLGKRRVAVTGIAHLSSNTGTLYELRRSSAGWQARRWRALPGMPLDSWLTPDGALLVNTYRGGPVLITADGDMRMAGCRD